jgi:hypothetical protein
MADKGFDPVTEANVSELIALAAKIRKSVSYPAYAGSIEAHTSGMAELITHFSGQHYAEVRASIVSAEQDSPETGLQTSVALRQVADE